MFSSVVAKISSVLVTFLSVLAKISSVLAIFVCVGENIICVATFSSVLAKISSMLAIFSYLLVENYVYCNSPTQMFPIKTTPLVELILFCRYCHIIDIFRSILILSGI